MATCSEATLRMRRWRAEKKLPPPAPLTSVGHTLFFAYNLLTLLVRAEEKSVRMRAYRATRKEHTATKNRDYEARNKVAIAARMKEYNEANHVAIAAYRKKYKAANKAAIRAVENARQRVRRATEPCFKLKQYLSNGLRSALSGAYKSARALELLGCAIEFFRQHIESQFQPGWSWANHGIVWELDHILPCAKFHLQHSEEQEICFHWTNFQPLLKADNRAKGDKVL